MARLTINRLLVASADIGDAGMPGTDASVIVCKIYVLRSGVFEAVGFCSTGCNQGYYQENYSYGPWRGRGDTAAAAASDMVRHVTAEWRDDIRRAAHEAMIDYDGADFSAAAAAEADRIEEVIANGERDGCFYALIAGKKHFVPADERAALRGKAVQILRRAAGPSRLAAVSDAEIIAEASRRGISLVAE